MTINTIFRVSCPDTDLYILCKMDANSLFNMRVVNKCANTVLDNDRFFKPFFFGCYTDLEGFKNKLFVILRKWHPDTCWKVACGAIANHKFDVSPSFCVVNIPQIRKVLDSKIEEKQAELKKICGSRPFDSDSPIHKAWEDYAAANPELIPLLSRLNEVIKPLRERGIDSISIAALVYKLNISEEDEMEEWSHDREVTSMFGHDKFMGSLYSIKEILKHLDSSGYEFDFYSDGSFKFPRHEENYDENKIRKAYECLEKSRKTFTKQLQRYKTQLEYLELPIKSFPNDIRYTQYTHPIEELAQTLKEELSNTIDFHNGIIEESLFEKCRIEIDVCLDAKDNDVNSLKKIRSLINASSQSAKIWERLWSEKGENIIDDSWAENHFHEFLPKLREIICKCEIHALNKKIASFELLNKGTKYLQD